MMVLIISGGGLMPKNFCPTCRSKAFRYTHNKKRERESRFEANRGTQRHKEKEKE